MMGTYRIYRLDGLGRIRGAEWLDAIDDRWALEGARALAESGGCEVWQRDRRIGRVSAVTSTNAALIRPGRGEDNSSSGAGHAP